MAQVIDGGTSGGSSCPYTLSIGGFTANVDQYSSSWNNSGTFTTTLNGKTLTIQSKNSSDYNVYRLSNIRIKVNGTTFIAVKLEHKHWALFQSNTWTESVLLRGSGSFSVPLSSTTSRTLIYSESGNYTSGDDYYYTVTQCDSTPKISSSGSYTITVEITVGDTTYSFNLGTLTVKAISLNSLSVSATNAKTKYYKNETFSSSNLSVTGSYKYQVSGNTAISSASITGYSISVSGFSGSTPKLTSTGNKTVTVSYGGKSTTYTITVYGVTQYTQPTVSSPRSTNKFRIGETKTLGNSTITYGGLASGYSSTTETKSVTNDFSSASAGTKTVNYSVKATRTDETLSWNSTAYIYDLTSITLDTSSVTKAFNCNETFSTANLVVTAHFGASNEAGSENVTSSATVTSSLPVDSQGNPMVGEFDVAAAYAYSPSGTVKTASYKVIRKGITDFDVEIPDEKIRIAKGSVFTKTDCTPKVKRLGYSNGQKTQDEVFQTFSGTWGISGTVDTSSAGNKEVTFYAEENGQTIYVTKTIYVYGHEYLEISGVNPPFKVFVENAQTTAKFNTTFIPELANLVVKAVTSDNQKETLTRGAVNNGYRFSPALDSNLSLGSNTITIIDTNDESVRATFNVEVAVNAIDYEGTFTVIGSLTQQYVSVGETIDLSNIHVYATMLDGTIQEVSFTANIEDKDDLEFDENDTVGDDYDIEVYVGEVLVATYSVTLNGISSISNVTASKLVYEVGEVFDPTTVTYQINYVDGTTESNKTGYITNERTTAFAYSEAGDTSDAGSVELEFKIKGFDVTLDVSVRKLIELEFVVPNNTSLVYQIGDALDIAAKNITIKKVYNDGNKVLLDENDDFEWVFTDGTNELTSCKVNNLIPESTRMSAAVKAYASMTVYGDYEIDTDTPLSLTVKAIRSVKLYDESLENEITEIILNEGETLGEYLIGKYVYVKLNNGDPISQEITSGYTGSSIAMNVPIISHSSLTANLSYTYGSETQNASITVTVHYLDDIESNIDEVLEANYYVGDELDLTDLVVNSVIASTDLEDENYPDDTGEIDFGSSGYQLSINGQNIDKDGYVFNAAATYVLAITYSGQTITRNIAVSAVALVSITPILSSSFKDFADYFDDQYLDLNGLTIRLTYNNGYTKDISYVLVDILDENGNAFNKTQQLSTSAHNGKKLYVSYNENGSTLAPVLIPSGNNDDGALVVTAKALTSIEVVQNPVKTSYTYGDTFSINGLIVKANFNNGNSENPNVNDLSISGVTVGHTFNPTNDATFGTIAITVSYTYGGVTKTDTFNITLVKPQINYLLTNAATDAVRKNWQDGDTFSTSGLVITAVMTNGWSCPVVTWSTNASTILNLDNSSKIQLTGDYGVKTITVSGTNPYDSNDSKTVTYDVDVETSGAIVSAIMMLDGEIDYKNYFVGDRYTAKGVSWRVTDIDGNVFTSGVFTTSVQIGSIFRYAQRITVQVTYSNGSFSKTETYDIIVSVAQLVTLTKTNNYQIAVGSVSGALFTEITHEEATIQLGKQYDDSGALVGEYYPIFHEDLISVDDNQAHTDTYGYNVYTGANAQNDCIGYMDMGLTSEDGTVIRKAHVILFDDPLNPIEGDGNIEVKFPHYVAGYADKINKCRFGVVYNNRLFVSGNPDYKNCDWHSGDVNFSQVEEYNNKAIKDYTYFSDLDYCFYGDNDTAVVGYDIYRDGDLVVVKEGSKHQATLYRRTMKLVNATSADGNVVGDDLAEAAFPMFDINSNGGVGGISHRSIVNFVGETIVLTKNGLKAITNKDDVYNTAKYTFDVSSFINDRITKEELASAILYVYKEMLLLKTNRGVYVGYYGLRNDDNEYEWYFLNNIDADIFFELDDELYFANNKGEICRFPLKEAEVIFEEYTDKITGNKYKFPIYPKSKYIDRERKFVGVGGTTLYIDSVNDKLVASATYSKEIVEGRPFHLLTSYTLGGVDIKTQIFASLGSFVNKNHKANTIINGGSFDQTAYVGLMDAENNTLEIKLFNSDGSENLDGLLDKQDLFYNGREVYVDNISGEGYHLTTYRRYFLKKYNEDNGNVYQLLDEQNQVVDLIGVNTMRMSFIVNDLAITHITDVANYNTAGAKEFALLGDHGKKLDLIYYNNVVGYYSGVITKEENVKSFFVTAPYALGGISLTKTIWEWIIANDTQLASYMDVGYLSSRKQGDYEMVIKSTSGSRQLDFSGINFEKIQFTSDKLPHVYARHRTVPNVNFIRFLFRNNEDSNMVLTTLNVIYTISEYTKGVK